MYKDDLYISGNVGNNQNFNLFCSQQYDDLRTLEVEIKNIRLIEQLKWCINGQGTVSVYVCNQENNNKKLVAHLSRSGNWELPKLLVSFKRGCDILRIIPTNFKSTESFTLQISGQRH